MTGLREMLDPEIAEVMGAIDLHLDRSVLGLLRQPPADVALDGVEVEDRAVPGEPGLVARLYRPSGLAGPAPCVYSMHGGGYVLGYRQMDDAVFARWCPALGVIGVSIEYRLAPETPYPGPLEDCYRGLAWTYEHADDLGVDRDRIGVAGLSAGGGLAAALALLARDRGEVPVAFQLLDSPMLDDRQVTPSSRAPDLPVWTRESNEFGWRSYLGDRHGAADLPLTAAPGRAGPEDLGGLPPAFVAVGAADGFRDEDILYALHLGQAGVPTELHVYPGACHGFQLVAGARVVRQAHADVDRWLARRVAGPA